MTDTNKTGFFQGFYNRALIVVSLGYDHAFHTGAAHDCKHKMYEVLCRMGPARMHSKFEVVVTFPVRGDPAGRRYYFPFVILGHPEPASPSN